MRHLRAYPLSLLCIAIIWALCLLKPPALPEGPEIPHLDKVVHLVMYLGLCTLLWLEHCKRSPQIRWKKFLFWGVVAPILMSGTIELAQAYLTPTRSGDWADFLANSLGVLLAIPFGTYVIRPLALRYFHRTK